MQDSPRSPVFYYIAAVVFTAAVVLLRWVLDPILLDTLPLVTLYGAVAAAVWVGGMGPAILSMILGYFCCAYLFTEPRGSFGLGDERNLVGFIAYLFTCSIIVMFGEMMRRAKQRLHGVAEEARKQAETLRITLSSIGDAVITTDAAGRVTFLNQVAQTLTEWSEQAAAGQPLESVFHIINEDTRSTVENPVEKVLKLGRVVGLANHTLLVSKNGVEQPIDDSAAPIRDESGRIAGVVLVFHSITERRKAEAELQASETRFRRVVSELPIPVIVHSEDDTVLAMSKGWTQFSGYTMEDMPTITDWTHLAYGERQATLKQFIDELFRLDRTDHTGEYQIRAKDGSMRTWDFYTTPLGYIGPAKQRLLLSTAIDVTERNRHENALREGEEQLRLAQSVARIGSFEWDIKTGVTRWTPELENLYGLRTGEFAGTFQSWEQLVHPEDRDEALRQMEVSLRTGNFEHEWRVVWRDGTVHWLAGRGRVFKDQEGNPLRMLGVNFDITDRKNAEDSLKESDRRKNEFLATLAHELRNPLAPIRNSLQIMQRANADSHAVSQARAVMERQIGHLVRLVNDLLDVNRISLNKLELHKAQIDLRAVLQSAIETSGPQFEGDGPELTVNLPAEPLYLDADFVRLSQVFANLLNNAAKFTDRGGRVILSATPQGNHAVVSVKDSGVGIPTDELPKIFEMFSQLNTSLTRSQGGLGIGLSLVRRLLQLHNGEIEAHSEGLGHGCEFIVRLPLATQTPKPTDKLDIAKQASSKNWKILVVDDNADSAESMAMLLNMMGHETQVAHDGLAAVDAAELYQPHIAMLDLGLPKLSGYDVARRLRGQPWGKKMILIALTGWSQEDAKRNSEQAGFDYHLVKPVDLSRLEAVLDELAIAS